MTTCPPAAEALEELAAVAVPAAASGGPISHAIFRVARLHRMHASQLLRRVGLHPAQELVMMQLWDRGPQRQSVLAQLVDSDAATMTRTVQRLENAGFVRRRSCEHDKRVTIIEPTAASLALRQQVEAIWARLEERTTRDLTPAQAQAFLMMLQRTEETLLARGLPGPTETVNADPLE